MNLQTKAQLQGIQKVLANITKVNDLNFYNGCLLKMRVDLSLGDNKILCSDYKRDKSRILLLFNNITVTAQFWLSVEMVS